MINLQEAIVAEAERIVRESDTCRCVNPGWTYTGSDGQSRCFECEKLVKV